MDPDVQRWVEAAQGGDMPAFGELVKMYQSRLYSLAYGMLGSADDAQEVVQLTWVKAWQKLGSFKRDAQFFTWVYRIASNLCLDHLRRRARRREDPLDDAVEPTPALDATPPDSVSSRPDTALDRQEQRALFDAALATLSPEHRLALTLREVDGLAYEEIATIMKCRVGTVMSRLFYARKQLAQRLGGHR